MKKHRVVVIYNLYIFGTGIDPENQAREDITSVSNDVSGVLKGLGYEVSAIGVTRNATEALETIKDLKPDAVFNLVESLHDDNRYEALMPLLLDLNGIAYTGSDATALTICLHKEKAKAVLAANAIATPRAVCMRESFTACPGLRFPLIVKPAREDASVGITTNSVVRNGAALKKQVQYIIKKYNQPALVEEFVKGREVYASVLCNASGKPEVMPLHEIDFSGLPAGTPHIVSFSGKWVEESVDYVGTTPVPVTDMPAKTVRAIKDIALRGYHAIGLRDYVRFDLRVNSRGVPYVIDVNPNCDLSRVAGGFSRASYAAGLTYEGLIGRIVEQAIRRKSANEQATGGSR